MGTGVTAGPTSVACGACAGPRANALGASIRMGLTAIKVLRIGIEAGTASLAQGSDRQNTTTLMGTVSWHPGAHLPYLTTGVGRFSSDLRYFAAARLLRGFIGNAPPAIHTLRP